MQVKSFTSGNIVSTFTAFSCINAIHGTVSRELVFSSMVIYISMSYNGGYFLRAQWTYTVPIIPNQYYDYVAWLNPPPYILDAAIPFNSPGCRSAGATKTLGPFVSIL